MNRHRSPRRACAAFALSLVVQAVMPEALAAAELAWTDVTVRIYDAGTVTGRAESMALRTAEAAFERAAVRLRWLACGPKPAAACRVPLRPGEISVRLVHGGGVAVGSPAALGDTTVDTGRQSASLATVYLDRVQALARASGCDAGLLLGRAIAHELVHALSGSVRHSTSGLMRPLWRGAEVARDHATDWMLGDADAQSVRSRLLGDQLLLAAR